MGLLNNTATPAADGSAHAQTTAASLDTPAVFDWMQSLYPASSTPGLHDLGDARSESAAALARNIVAPLAHRTIIRAHGADVDSFLQGQLSNDIRELTPTRAQLSSYSNPKGRVLAVLALLRAGDAVLMETEAEIAPAILKRLRMFVLRSKVKLAITPNGDAALGLSGPTSASLLEQAGLPAPAIVWGCAESTDLVVMRRPDGPFPRYSIHGSSNALAGLWPTLAKAAHPVGTTAWRLLDLLAGVPSIHADTSEQHVAQMLNLDKLDGISFVKGCYPGQEIIARLHYLGSLKRRLFVGYAAGDAAVSRGMPVFAADGSSQPVGEVLDVVPHPTQGSAVQLVLQIANRESALRLGAVDGPVLTLA